MSLFNPHVSRRPSDVTNYSDVVICGIVKVDGNVVNMEPMSSETEAMRTAIANQLRLQRTKRRWSQDDLAKAAGLGRSTVIRIETNKIAMDMKHLTSIAKAFDMPWIEFMQLVNDELEAQ